MRVFELTYFNTPTTPITEIAEGPGSKCGNQKILSMRRRSSAYSNLCPSGFVDPVHMFTELWAVAVSVSVVRGHKQQRMDHFMKESLREQNNKTIYLENVSIVFFVSLPMDLE